MNKETILKQMDTVEYLANHTLNEYIANGKMEKHTASFLMGRLGSQFIFLDYEKVPVPFQNVIDREWNGN